jgi:hypothetical protein
VVEPLLDISGRWRNSSVDRAVNTALGKIKVSNAAPSVRDGKATCPEGGSVAIELGISDPDDVVSYAEIRCGRPGHGSVKAPRRRNWHECKVTYHNHRGFVGEDSFEWSVRDGMGSNSPSAKVTVTITPDTTGPKVSDVSVPLGTNTVVIARFNEPVKAESAQADRFSIRPEVRILGVSLDESGESVVLETAPLAAHTEYTLTAEGIRDRARAANAGDSTAGFVYRPLVAGLTWSWYEGVPVYPKRSRELKDVDVSGMEAVVSGEVPGVRLSMTNRAERFTVRFDGVIQVPRRPDGRVSGSYTFAILSSGSSRLYIDGRQLTDNRRGERGSGITLASGPHRIAVFYSHWGRSEPKVTVTWSGPGIRKQEIPAAALFHQAHAR